MKLKGISRYCCAGLIMVIAGVMLAGCKSSGQSTPAAATKSPGDTYTSKTLSTAFTGALNASSQLMLGMLRLEGSDNAITSEQAKTMLSLLRPLQGQALKADAELNAVLAAIEAQLTPAQLSAIANMHLTQDDLQAWTKDNSQAGGAGPGQGGAGPQGTPGAPPAGGGAPPASGGGARPAQMPTRQAQAGGAAPRANAGGAGVGFGQGNVSLNSLIRLLATKSGGPAGPAPIKP